MNLETEIITKEFLENVLEKEGKFPKEIQSFKISEGTKPGTNFASVVYTVDLELKCGRERRFVVKCSPSHPSRQEFTNKGNMFHKECVVYTQWIPELRRISQEKLPYAPFVHGECIDFNSREGKAHLKRVIHPLENYIVMEDIRKYGFVMANRRVPLDILHLRLVVQTLAKVHSISWVYLQKEPEITSKFPCMGQKMAPEITKLWADVTKSSLTQAAEMLEQEELSRAVQRFRDFGVDPAVEYFAGGGDVESVFKNNRIDVPSTHRVQGYQEVPWRVICHGDCNSNNLMFKYSEENNEPSEIILLDLQLPNEGCVTKDLQYVFYTSMDGDLRRGHLDQLLQLYYEKFNKNCKTLGVESLPGFTLEELKYRFQRSKGLGFLMASMVLPFSLKEEEGTADMDRMEEKDLTDMFTKVSSEKSNSAYKKRFTDITKEMFDQGII